MGIGLVVSSVIALRLLTVHLDLANLKATLEYKIPQQLMRPHFDLDFNILEIILYVITLAF